MDDCQPNYLTNFGTKELLELKMIPPLKLARFTQGVEENKLTPLLSFSHKSNIIEKMSWQVMCHGGGTCIHIHFLGINIFNVLKCDFNLPMVE